MAQDRVCDDLTSIVQRFVIQLASSAIQSQQNVVVDLTDHPASICLSLAEYDALPLRFFGGSVAFICRIRL